MPKTQSFPSNIISSITNALTSDAGPTEAIQEKHAIKLLMSQHREVEDLFAQIEALGEKSVEHKKKLFSTLAEKFLMHCMIEEKIFYPAVTRVDKDLILEAREEHDNAKAMVAKIQKLKPTHETYDAKICVLKELIQHHVKEEERELFPKVEAKLTEENLLEIGEQMFKKTQKSSKVAPRKKATASKTRKVTIQAKAKATPTTTKQKQKSSKA